MYKVLSTFVAKKACMRPWRAKPNRAKACQGLNMRSNHDITPPLSRTSPNHCAISKRARDPAIIAGLLLKALYIRNNCTPFKRMRIPLCANSTRIQYNSPPGVERP